MDEKIQKAFETANYMATLSNQRRIILEEYNQRLTYYQNGGTFQVSPQLITFVKTVLDTGHDSDVPFLDVNNYPIMIADVRKFLDDLTDIYFNSLNEYYSKFSEIKSKRKIKDIVDL